MSIQSRPASTDAADVGTGLQAGPAPHRFAALDAMRGFASVSVMLWHVSMLSPLLWIRNTPLHIVLGGHQAVILFFALSGYVLALQISSSTYEYPTYAIKRVCRIYLPYVVALAITLFVASIVPSRALGLGTFFDRAHGIGVGAIVAHVLLIGQFNSRPINPVIWSLVYELRISLVMPLVIAAIARFGIARVVPVSFLGSVGVAFVMTRSHHSLYAASFDGSWLATIHYLFIFTCGAALAIARHGFVARLRSGVAMCIFAVGIVLYVGSDRLSSSHHVAIRFVWDWILVAAVCCLMQCLIADNPVSRFLSLKPFVLLGRISYSLYLYHILVIQAVIGTLFGTLSLAAVLSISLALSLGVAYVGFVAVEAPATRLGYILAASIHRERRGFASS